jgi:CubicO group peptidase (beta-lactamase class C family)
VTYFPAAQSELKRDWETAEPSSVNLNAERLAEAVTFAEANESPWPRDLEQAGSVPGLTQIERPPWNKALGPFKPRGGPSGLILKGGKIAASWGDPGRVDMTFSIAKSYLAVLCGVAIGDGLIKSVDDCVGDYVSGDLFASEQNSAITWRHLLTQTSEWEGTLFDKPDLIDRNRQVGPGSDNSRKSEHRDLSRPGTFWEYNDVRVNVLALSLLHVFKRPLPEVLKDRIMDPIGASSDWSWHGYDNSWVEIDGKQMQSVPGGTHWGGGIHISSFDHARFALLVHNRGQWNGTRILPESWCEDLHAPSEINPGYGYLWWLNTNGTEYPGTPRSSYAALGAGTSIIWIDPDDDLIVVARWVDQEQVTTLLAKTYAALA